MHIKKRYDQTLLALQKGHRYQKPLTIEEKKEIHAHLFMNSPHLDTCLCLLQNTSSFLSEFSKALIDLLTHKNTPPETIIHGLNASRRHIIDAHKRLSNRLPLAFLETLKGLLYHSNWEVKEWTLRTIEECGSQALFFKKDLSKIYPSKLGMITNRHKRFSAGIIDIISQRWHHEI